MIAAVLAPDSAKRSVRQELLSQDARDLLAWAFDKGLGVGPLEMPISAAEVKIGDRDVEQIAFGEGGFRFHAGANSDCYFRHLGDPGWAVVYKGDCNGDPGRGQCVADRLSGSPASTARQVRQ